MIGKYIICAIGAIKVNIFHLFYWNKFSAGLKTIAFPSVQFQIDRNSKIYLGENVSIRRNCEINARNNGVIKIGNNSFLNSGCILTAHKSITIGDNVEFGPNVLVFDHDHKFKDGYEAKKFDCESIEIGNNVWVGAGTIILRGTKIGDNSVIAAGSIVKGEIQPMTLFVQKRSSEKMPIL